MEPILLIIAGIVLALAIGFVVRKLGGTRDPETPTPDRPAHARTGAEDPTKPDIPRYPTGSNPGGPGAEAMNATVAGAPAPGDPGGVAEEDVATDDAVLPSEAARMPLDEDR